MTPDPADENCDGMIDNVTPSCDTGLVLDSADPMDGAKAIGICDLQYIKTAKWVVADGLPPNQDPTKLANFHLGHGIWSMTQSLGIWGTRFTPAMMKVGVVIAFVLAIGFASMPIAILAGALNDKVQPVATAQAEQN